VDGEVDRAGVTDEEKPKPPERRSPGRPHEDARRKRGTERRFAGWGDGVDRFFCARDGRRIPAGFPVEARHGVAIIPPTVVARRPDSILLCTFEHGGAHAWPDGEVVATDDASPGATEGAG
jgi:hypothetical protein